MRTTRQLWRCFLRNGKRKSQLGGIPLSLSFSLSEKSLAVGNLWVRTGEITGEEFGEFEHSSYARGNDTGEN